MSTDQTRLILVYNADSGLPNALKDAVWKVVRPSTYPCSLCALTYGYVSMHGQWRRFLARLPHFKVFHHRDDFAQAFPELTVALPAILLVEAGAPAQVLISADELKALPDLDALIQLAQNRVTATQA